MVQKLKSHYPVKKRLEYIQIDPVAGAYVITVWDENVQFFCDYNHLLLCAKELIDAELSIEDFQFAELDPSQDEKICQMS